MTTPPGYSGQEIDTEGVYGNAGAAPRGTQNLVSNTETATPAGAAYGGGANVVTGGTLTGTPDTEGIGTGANGPYVPNPPPLLTGTLDTQTLGWPLTSGVTQAYRAPNTTIGLVGAAGAFDTTRTDTPITDGSIRNDYQQNLSGTLESGNIGAIGPVSALVPVAPSGTPTVAAGARTATVTWSTVADPDATAPVLGYVIIGSTGGTTYTGRGVTTAVVTNLVPDLPYSFQVLARNRNGNGPLGTASATVTPYNPDEPDVGKPGGLDPYWAQNPIYGPDGTVKAGSGLAGRPAAPTSVVLTGNGTVGGVVATWVAPATGGTVSSYTVTLSSGQTKSVSASTLTTTFTGVANATAITATVTSVGSVANATSTASAVFGKPTAPAAPTATSPSAGTIHVVWTAPTSGAPINYIVTLAGQDTTSHTVAGTILTNDFTALTTGHVDTVTVGAQGSVSTTTSAASGNVTVT
jgi:hypothetical protein